MVKKLICRVVGHREHEFEWENGSVTVDCERCGKLVSWYVPVRYRDMGEMGEVLAFQQNQNQAALAMLEFRHRQEQG